MLTLLGSRRTKDCQGLARRDFLKAGALSVAGLGTADLLRARAAAENAGRSTRKKSVIWLWLSGGPSPLETWDPKPSNPESHRGVVGHLQTVVPGTLIGGLYTKIASHTDKLAIVRSFSHRQADHAAASHWVMTGHDYPPAANGAAAIQPSLGSMISRHRGATDPVTGLPVYASTDHMYADGPVWLGRPYTPFHVRDAGVANMMPRLQQDRLADRRSLLRAFDTINRNVDASGTMHGMDSFDEQATQILRGAAFRAFDIRQEDPRLRDRYGPKLGENLLLARRLCEAGVGFVTVYYGGWDSHGTNPAVNHGTIEEEMHKLAPSFDQAVSAYLEDVRQRGLEDDILLVIAAEFGRTPWLDRVSLGRDHWPQLGNFVFAGGGLKMGQVVGASAARSDVPRTTPIGPQDIMATVFHVMDVPLDLTYIQPNGRPTRMIEEGKPIAELI